MQWYLAVLRNYTGFSGRATRTEYWMFALVNAGIYLVLEVLSLAANSNFFTVLYIVYAVFVLLPGVAVGVRRLHDIGRSGWWTLIAVIPLIGAVILLIWEATDSQPGENQYGPNPKGLAPGTPVASWRPGGQSQSPAWSPGAGTQAGAWSPVAAMPAAVSDAAPDATAPAPAASAGAPANWYPDPSGAKRLRYWDGTAWTEQTAD